MQRYHIIIDITGISQEKLTDTKGIENLLNTLPGQIGMNILVAPKVVEGIPENPGITGYVIIDFSHISVHTFTNKDLAMVDVFSCKAYDQEVATNFVLNFFGVDKSHAFVKEVFWG